MAVNLPPEARVRLVKYVEPAAGDIDITQQDVLVSVGRGLQGAANLDLAEELAEALGGAVSGSRPAIDMGWLPMTRQVGKSGMKVKPKLYLAAGHQRGARARRGHEGRRVDHRRQQRCRRPHLQRGALRHCRGRDWTFSPALAEVERKREGVADARPDHVEPASAYRLRLLWVLALAA